MLCVLIRILIEAILMSTHNTVQILCIGTDRSQQTVQTKIRLLLKKQSDQGLCCLPFHPHLLDALMQCYVKLLYFLGQLWQLFEVSQILEFLRYSIFNIKKRGSLSIIQNLQLRDFCLRDLRKSSKQPW